MIEQTASVVLNLFFLLFFFQALKSVTSVIETFITCEEVSAQWSWVSWSEKSFWTEERKEKALSRLKAQTREQLTLRVIEYPHLREDENEFCFQTDVRLPFFSGEPLVKRNVKGRFKNLTDSKFLFPVKLSWWRND